MSAEPGPTCGDPRFFRSSGPYTAAEIADAAGAVIDGDGGRLLRAVAPLQAAGVASLSFLDNRRYIPALTATGAGAVIVHPELRAHVPAGCVALVTADPYAGWARAASLFHPEPPACPGAHPTAVVAPAAVLDATAEVGPYAVIGADARIGARVRVGAHAVIGDGVTVGPDSRIGPHCSVSHAVLGARVVLHTGARIGQEGFGFATVTDGFVTVPQLGRVLIADDVQVGANTTIDRGSAQDTVIGAGSRLDNLVMIGHNVQIGRCCVIVAQAGIAGSTVLEDFVTVAGQAGLTGHLRIGRGAKLGAQSGIMADVPAGQSVVGSPATEVRAYFRQIAVVRRLAARPPAKPAPPSASKESA